MWLVSHATGWSDRSGRFGDTMRWVREVIAGRLPTVGATVRDGCARRLGCSAPLGVRPLSIFGLSGDTRVRVIGSHIHLVVRTRSGRSGDTMICEMATFCTRVQVGTARDASAIPSVGSEWGSCTDGSLRRHHGLWVGLRFAHGCRSVPLGTLCDTFRLGRCVPGDWVGHFALVKCYTCLRGASGVRLLTFGQRLV